MFYFVLQLNGANCSSTNNHVLPSPALVLAIPVRRVCAAVLFATVGPGAIASHETHQNISYLSDQGGGLSRRVSMVGNTFVTPIMPSSFWFLILFLISWNSCALVALCHQSSWVGG